MNAPDDTFDGDRLDGDTDLEPIDLLLGQGAPEVRDACRSRIATDPLAMIDMAETVALLEGLRQLRTEPSAVFRSKLIGVVQRAERRVPPREPTTRFGPLWAAAAAVITFALLWLVDPLAHRHRDARVIADGAPRVVPAARAVVGASAGAQARTLAWESAVEQMRAQLGMQPTANLLAAFEAGLEHGRDPLRDWLDPRNALELMRLDHELRASAAVRREVLRRQGGLPDADERVQQLANAIAAQLPDRLLVDRDNDVAAISMAVRALIAGGPDGGARDAALRSASAWLARRAATANGAQLVSVLAALVEVAAVTGEHTDVAARHGDRLVADIVVPDDHNWARSLPELLGTRVPTPVLAEAGRLLTLLPGLGVDAGHCDLARRLLLGRLRDRRDAGDDSPELVGAMLFGSADLLAEAERDALELRLRRWLPGRLAPDYVTVHLLAWALEPGRRGFTRWQAELRLLAVQPDPLDLHARAAFCLCLATNYAAFGGGVVRLVAASL